MMGINADTWEGRGKRDGEGWVTGLGLLGVATFVTTVFAASPIPHPPSRFAGPASRVLSATSGCHPTVRIPSADRANNPMSTPPAVPRALTTPAPAHAGIRPISFWEVVHRP